MESGRLGRPIGMVARPDDAAATYEDLHPYLLEVETVRSSCT